MLDLKPYGAFIENTIRPILEEARTLLKEIEAKGIDVNEVSIKRLLAYLFECHLGTLILGLAKDCTIVLIIAVTAYLILK